MDKPNNKLTQQSNPQQAPGKKSLLQGGVIVFLIAMTPFIFYSYKSFPEGALWETTFFQLETSYGSWVNTAWYIVTKVIPIFLLLIWFFTCRHWWHWIILVPITMYSFQLWNILNVTNSMDEVELVYIVPLLMILVPFVYLIRAKLFVKIRGNDLDTFEKELSAKKNLWTQIQDLFR